MFVVSTTVVALLLWGAQVPQAGALQLYQTEIPNGDRVVRGGQAWPGVGHQVPQGSGDRNAFGVAFQSAGHRWSNGLCNADSDGDGFTNGQELGDPSCTWAKGATPERSTGVSHPGFSDSTPAVQPATSASSSTPTSSTSTSSPGAAKQSQSVAISVVLVLAFSLMVVG